MHLYYFFFVVIVAFQISDAKVVGNVPEVTRKVHGSYGPFRDFNKQDCDQPHENAWMRCTGGETNSFAYHWNNRLRGCERVIYKGCGATRNSFVTERDCTNQAKSICTK